MKYSCKLIKIALILIFVTAIGFSQSPDTLYPVKVFTENGYKFGYINNEGYISIKPQYAFAKEFSEGRAFVYKGTEILSWECINVSAETEFNLQAITVMNFNNGLAKFVDPAGNIRYIDPQGALIDVVSPKEKQEKNYPGAFILNEKYGYMQNEDSVLLPATYERAGEFSEGLAPVFIKFKESELPKDNCYNAFINEKGDVIIKAELKYDDKGYLESGYFFSPGKWQNGVCRYYTSNDPLTRAEKYIRSDGKIIW